MDGSREAEHHYVVAGLNNRVTVNEHSLSVAYKSGYGHVTCQRQVLYGAACNLALGLRLDFGNFGIGKCKALRRRHISVEQNLEYLA